MDIGPGQVLVVPEPEKSTIGFFKRFWVDGPSIYLFPLKVVIQSDYDPKLSESAYRSLCRQNLITVSYQNRRYSFHAIEGLSIATHFRWAIYILIMLMARRTYSHFRMNM